MSSLRLRKTLPWGSGTYFLSCQAWPSTACSLTCGMSSDAHLIDGRGRLTHPWDLTCHSGKRPLTLAFSNLERERHPAPDPSAPFPRRASLCFFSVKVTSCHPTPCPEDQWTVSLTLGEPARCVSVCPCVRGLPGSCGGMGCGHRGLGPPLWRPPELGLWPLGQPLGDPRGTSLGPWVLGPPGSSAGQGESVASSLQASGH